MTVRARKRLRLLGIAAIALLAVAASQLPVIGAMLLLHPVRRPVPAAVPPACEAVVLRGEGVNLQGWRGSAAGQRRGTLVFLHGVADNRASGTGVIERFRRRGFDVLAYDSRAHGESAGPACTYGFFEKQDLMRVLDSVGEGPVVLLGNSLGGAVALQAAACDRRISAVIAVESFSDLRTVATQRAPFFFTAGTLASAFRRAEDQGHFPIDAVSPALAAREITVPVLLVHGACDTATPPDHSRRILGALAGPKRLIVVEGAGHNQSLRGEVWTEIEAWLDQVLGAGVTGGIGTAQ